MINVRTNKQWRTLHYPNDVSPEVFANYIHLMNDFDLTFFKYKGEWYCADDFMSFADLDTPLQDASGVHWDRYLPFTFSSGLVLRYDDYGEQVMIGCYWVTPDYLEDQQTD